MSDSNSEQLCLACGLCCNGVLFADVQLQAGDYGERLRDLGLRFRKSSAGREKFSQPCAAHDGCRCAIYTDRPTYCRAFECSLLESVAAGLVRTDAALRIIRSARKRAERVHQLLCQLGDADEARPLSQRFRRTRTRIEASVMDEETADLFGQLTLAVHDLNFYLSQNFYPGQ